MNRRAKLREKLLSLPTRMDFGDVEKVLMEHGFELLRTSGSHHIFSDGEIHLTVPTVQGRFVKRTYLVMIAGIISPSGEEGETE